MTRRALAAAALVALATALGAQPAASRTADLRTGDRAVPAGERIRGDLVVLRGNVEVSGEVEGDLVAVKGDITVRRGGLVRGDAVAIGGRVTLDGGRVLGQRFAVDPFGGAAEAAGRVEVSRGRLLTVLGAIAGLLALLAIATTMIAQPALDGVSSELARDVGRSLLAGGIAQLCLVPGLVLTVVGLSLTIVGVILVPFAVVAYVLASAGLVTLGLLGTARLVGGVLWGAGASRHSASRASLGGVLTGLSILLVPWAVAVGLGEVWPSAEWLLRLAAAGVTWVAVTAGMGAVLLSRVGTRPTAAPVVLDDAYAWATPTPVTGVAAARRPAVS